MKLTADLVALCERPIDDPGPEPGKVQLTIEEMEDFAGKLAADLDGGPLWLFAYGSLIWKPAFEAVESHRATARGWHRAFAMHMTRWRGTPEAPGLMMVLDRGGICHGVAYRLPDGSYREQIYKMLWRETEYQGDLESIRWIGVETDMGRIKALAFWATPRHGGFGSKLTPDETARRIAQACGDAGSNSAYLYQTVSKLDELGIRDRNLWHLQELVADEITRLHSP